VVLQAFARKTTQFPEHPAERVMELFEAIYGRASIAKVKPDPVPRDTIEKLLSAAVQAPNHHRIRPWRFVVLTGEARNRLGEVMARSLKARLPETNDRLLEIESAKPLRAPLVIAVGVDKPAIPKVVDIENVCAVAAAVENLLLAAVGLGLAAMWRTGGAAFDPQVKAFLGFAPDQHLIGFVYVGYAEAERTPVERPSFGDRTTWME
jgi:nitroreductase